MESVQRTGSYVEWSAIIAGAVIACAVSLVLLHFGAGVGLTSERLLEGDANNLNWRVFAVGIWLLWVQLISTMFGAYIAGRMRRPIPGATPHESEVRDGVHGLLVWTTATLASAATVALGGFMTALIAALAPDVPDPTTTIVPLSEELARKTGIVFGFFTAAACTISAIAGWWMGTVGGDHRDSNLDLSRLISFRRR